MLCVDQVIYDFTYSAEEFDQTWLKYLTRLCHKKGGIPDVIITDVTLKYTVTRYQDKHGTPSMYEMTFLYHGNTCLFQLSISH